MLLAMVGFCGCRSHSATSPAQQKVVQPLVQQPAQARVETEEEKSCRKFVQGFYDWYLADDLAAECRHSTAARRAANSKDLVDSSNACKRASDLQPAKGMSMKLALSPQLTRMLGEDEAWKAKNQDGIVGLEGDPFLRDGNSGDYYAYSTDEVRVQGGQCFVRVNEHFVNENGGTEGKLYDSFVVELSDSRERWRIANVHYRFDPGNGKPPEDEDLVSDLKSLGYR